MENKKIKITVFWAKEKKEYFVERFKAQPFDNEGIYLELDDGYTLVCDSIEVEFIK